MSSSYGAALLVVGLIAGVWWLLGSDKPKQQSGEKGSKDSKGKTAAGGIFLGLVAAWALKNRSRFPLRWQIVGGLALAAAAAFLFDAPEVAWPVLVGTLALTAANVVKPPRRNPGGKPSDESFPATAAAKRLNELMNEPRSPLASLAGSHAEVTVKDAVSWSLRLELGAGKTADQVLALTGPLESAIDARPGSLRVLPSEERSRLVGLRVIARDQLAQPIRWTEPVGRTILDPIYLGRFEDGEDCTLRLLPAPGAALNVALAGQPGAGKSGLLNVLVAALAGCRDVVLGGIDPTGVELSAWESCFDRELLALEGGDEAEDVLVRVLAIMAQRNRLLRAKGVRVWTPSPEHPELVLIVDEAAAVAKHVPLLDKIASQGRKDGIHVVAATQRPSAAALGDAGKEFLSKLQCRVALRLSEAADCDVAMGRGAGREGWRSDLVCRRRGEFLIRSDTHLQPRVARGLLVTDQDVEGWARRCAEDRPRLESAEAR